MTTVPDCGCRERTKIVQLLPCWLEIAELACLFLQLYYADGAHDLAPASFMSGHAIYCWCAACPYILQHCSLSTFSLLKRNKTDSLMPLQRCSAALGYMVLLLDTLSSILDTPLLTHLHYQGSTSSLGVSRSFWEDNNCQIFKLHLFHNEGPAAG